MKKVLLFVVLFGAGLLLLRWLERPEEAPPGNGGAQQGGEQPVVVVDQPGDEGTGNDASGEGDGQEPDLGAGDPTDSDPQGSSGDQDPVGLVLSGPFASTLYDSESGQAVLRIKSEDSATANERDQLIQVEATILEPNVEEPQAVVEAKRASVRRTGMNEDLGPRHENRLELEGVEALVRSGVPLVPLEFTAPTAVIDVVDEKSRRLSTPEKITMTSPRLGVSGEGLDVFFDQDMLVVRENGVVRFREGDTLAAELSCSGPTRIFGDVENEASEITIEANEGARLEFFGESPSVLEAQVIRIQGKKRPEESEGDLTIESLVAEGGFVWTAGQDVFQGRRVDVKMNAEGQLEQASLNDLPSLRLRLRDAGAIVPDAPAGEPLVLRVSDEESIVITWKEGTRYFRTRGPSSVEVEGFSLRANGGIDGSEDEADDSASFTARGGVVLETSFGSLETGELEARFFSNEAGEPVLEADARIGPRLTGRLGDERPFSFTSPESLKVERVGDRWRIVEAESVVVSVEGEDGFSARADRVEGFDPVAVSFIAEGNVSFEGRDGRSTGQRLVVHSSTHYEIEGTPERKAIYDGADGRAEALWAERRGARIRARGDVDASIAAVLEEGEEGQGRYDIRCEEITVDRISEEPDAAGELRRTLRLDAVGPVTAVVTTTEDKTDLSSGSLSILRFEYVEEEGGDPVRMRSTLRAETDVIALIDTGGSKIDVSSNVLVVEQDRTEEFDLRSGTAEGDVRFEMSLAGEGTEQVQSAKPLRLSGQGETLTWDQQGGGSLVPLPGQRVAVAGVLPSHQAPFELQADAFRFQPGGLLFADRPELNVTELLNAVRRDDGARTREESRVLKATAAGLEAGPGMVELFGAVRIQATAGEGSSWVLDTERIRFLGSPTDASQGLPVSSIEAEGGISFALGKRGDLEDPWIATATGKTLEGDSLSGTLRLTGTPASIESALFTTEADWIEFDPELRILTASGPGRLVPAESAVSPWSLEFQSSRTRIEPDSLILILQEPIYSQPTEKADLRSSWATFWIDRRSWMELPSRNQDDPPRDVELKPEKETRARLFNLFENTALAGLLRETYFEGPVEILYDSELLARADAIFLDVVQGHGWLANPTVTIRGELVGQSFDKLIVKTDWLRHSSDGSLRANQATVTPCDFDDPHLKVVTGDLRLTPIASNGKPEYDVELRNNRIELYDKLRLPLPPFHYSADEKGRPLWETLRLGDSARFGSFVSAGLVRPAGKVGKSVNKILGGNPFEYDANYRVNASYLGSRGVLLDLGLEIESQDNYWLDMTLGGVPDDGEDRGFIRVPEDDRDNLRLWYRARSRYILSEKEWIDLAITTQTDAGVQSEFFEDEFIRYERDENFLRWRKVISDDYLAVSVKKRFESFRTDIEELPSAQAYLGRRPLGKIGSVPIVHTGDVRAEYLQRREGDADLDSPFGIQSPFSDGLRERETVRVDTTQTLEAPMKTGVLGLKATPYVSARATAWSKGVDRDDSPTRLLGQAGLRLATTFWKRTSGGGLNTISPFFDLHGDFFFDEDGEAVAFDRVEQNLEGTFAELGIRTRLDLDTEGNRALDLEVRGGYGFDLPGGQDDGFLPVAVLGRVDIAPFNTPFQVWHDAQYDFESGDTRYALTSLAYRVGDGFRMEAGHHFGRGAGGRRLFEAASIAGAYRWTEKWELEGRQTFSLSEDDNLDTRLLLRRFGHDIIFEIETSVREGEGSSFSFGLEPRFGWKPSGLGFLDY